MIDILAAIFLVIGCFFISVGVLGVIRLPDAHSRLHASGKVGTVGLFSMLIGIGILLPASSLKLLVLALFLVLSLPVTSHAIALTHSNQE